jgi:hypothetical protein
MDVRRPRFLWFLCAVCALCAFARADELRLRDGTTIKGTIVGFEDDHFKVETAYGFALVRRDRVAAITMSDAKAASARKPAAPAKAPPPTPPVATPAAPPAAPPTSSPASSPPPAAPATPPPAPRIREEVDGTTYTNHTYGFRLYKPPSWQVIEGAHRPLPNAVVAMGTGDETTLLVVGREPLRGSLQSQAAVTERRLGEIYENYRSLGDETASVAGLPAVSRRFRGTVEGRDWSGRVVWVAQGSDLFTIFGMTYADSDLIQIQENVISRTIASLEFIAPR